MGELLVLRVGLLFDVFWVLLPLLDGVCGLVIDWRFFGEFVFSSLIAKAFC